MRIQPRAASGRCLGCGDWARVPPRDSTRPPSRFALPWVAWAWRQASGWCFPQVVPRLAHGVRKRRAVARARHSICRIPAPGWRVLLPPEAVAAEEAASPLGCHRWLPLLAEGSLLISA